MKVSEHERKKERGSDRLATEKRQSCVGVVMEKMLMMREERLKGKIKKKNCLWLPRLNESEFVCEHERVRVRDGERE